MAETGQQLELVTGPIAHGGHVVARHHGAVVFVRHALPGERVVATVTGVRAKYLTADAVQVLVASPARVTPPCPYAGPGRCGGCDFQHVAVPEQRALKAAVVREQLHRLAGIDLDVVVEPLPGDQDGLRWRTRVELAVDGGGRAGLHRFHSHDVVPLDDCLIAAPGIADVLAQDWSGARAVDVVAPGVGDRVVLPRPSGPVPTVIEQVAGTTFQVSARGFWQVHPGAAAAFVAQVLDVLAPAPGERAMDLYAGAGLFAHALATAVGESGSVLAVESDARACADAVANLAGRPQAQVRHRRVDRVLRTLAARRRHTGVVVLDPPRTGAGRAVVRDIAALRPRAVAYVACDPATLARDLAHFGDAGYRAESVRAFDAFPMTHHVECIAHLVRH
ncbi:MAG TPA: class I SAM-dependent RNA methyltransferase [Dermatophilaceae bacterium]|nr:class I SAM-dependent RNA methyltransferase [Dermatophilaceae bacterium]